ncbi:MAG: helix-turn-helix domain-containing protein [Chloroflexi bacterium]|nr:helix-turn-helix domain-containing protein [Chloroflexota bacterium]
MTDQVHKLGEELRAAREAKGVDLSRVERDTKIRERYLAALERGEYRELPGPVYTKGFLRNYGTYLALDPEYLIDLYRLETSAWAPERSGLPSPPRPISVRRRRTFVVTSGAVAAAILTIAVGAMVAWIGYQLFNFARMPVLQVMQPVGDVAAHPDTTITIRGMTAANATVTVRGLPANPSVVADEDGNFEMTVELLPGSNEIRMVATDPLTRRPSPELIRRVNVVGGPAESPGPTGDGAVGLTLEQPQAGATLAAPVPVAGTALAGSTATLSAALVERATPNFAITDLGGRAVELELAAPTAPEPTTLTADAAGAFAGSLALAPGTWGVVVTPATGEPITRRITVPPGEGLTGTLHLDGGESYLEVEEDASPVDGVSGGIVADGESVELTASDGIRIRAGNAGAVRLTINGIGIGFMGDDAAVVEWLIARSGD